MGKRGKRDIVLICLCLLLLSGCAGKQTSPPPDSLSLAQAMAAKAADPEALSPISDKVLKKLLLVEEDILSDAALVMDASRATTTQFAVLTAKDEATAKGLEDTLKAYQAMVLEQYRDYVPGEVPRIEKALIRRQGRQAVFVICDEPQLAEEVLKEYWK